MDFALRLKHFQDGRRKLHQAMKYYWDDFFVLKNTVIGKVNLVAGLLFSMPSAITSRPISFRAFMNVSHTPTIAQGNRNGALEG